MHRRDRRDDELNDAPRQREEAPAPPSSRLAGVLALQRSVGNREVAKLLGRSGDQHLQREAVQGAATWQGERHHPQTEFTFADGSQQRPDVDNWYAGKSQGPGAYAATLTPMAVTGIIGGYNGNGSILDLIVRGLVGLGGTMGAPDLDRLGDKGYTQQGQFTVDDAVAQAPGGKEFAAHFLALQHNVGLRVADMDKSVVTSVKVQTVPKTAAAKFAPKAETKNYKLDWNLVLDGGRALLAPLLQAAQLAAPPMGGITLQDTAFAAAGGNFATLRAMGILGDREFTKSAVSGEGGTKATYTVKEQTPAKTTTGNKMSLIFGLNHIRSILYMEWLATYQLRQLAQAAPQQVPQILQAVAQIPQVLQAVVQVPQVVQAIDQDDDVVADDGSD